MVDPSIKKSIEPPETVHHSDEMIEEAPIQEHDQDQGGEPEEAVEAVEEDDDQDKDHRSIIVRGLIINPNERTPSRSSSRPSSSSSFSTNRTIIEVDQQLNQLDHTTSIEDVIILNQQSRSQPQPQPQPQPQLQLRLQPSSSSSSSSSSSNRVSIRFHQLNRVQSHRPDGDGADDDDRSSEHERRLRLIDANRTMSRLVTNDEDDEDLDSQPHHHPTTLHHHPITTLDHDASSQTITIQILLSSINQKTCFDLDRLMTILQLKDHLLHHWPADWDQKEEVPRVNHLNQLRMVYMGRFLDDTDTLNSLGMIRPVIIHLAIKPEEAFFKEGLEHHDLRVGLWSYCCFGRARRSSARDDEPHPPPPPLTTTTTPSHSNRLLGSLLPNSHRGCLIS